MMTLKLTDQKVRRVLECLTDFKRRSLKEITLKHNELYPPAFGLFSVSERAIKDILDFLIAYKLIRSEVLSFTSEPIPETKFYSLTTAGVQSLMKRR